MSFNKDSVCWRCKGNNGPSRAFAFWQIIKNEAANTHCNVETINWQQQANGAGSSEGTTSSEGAASSDGTHSSEGTASPEASADHTTELCQGNIRVKYVLSSANSMLLKQPSF